MKAFCTPSVVALALILVINLLHWTPSNGAAAVAASSNRQLKGNIFDHVFDPESSSSNSSSWKSKKGASSKASKSQSLAPTASSAPSGPTPRPSTEQPTTSNPTTLPRPSTASPTSFSFKGSSKYAKKFKSSKSKKGSKSSKSKFFFPTASAPSAPQVVNSTMAPVPASVPPTARPLVPTTPPVTATPSRTIAPTQVRVSSKSLKGSKKSSKSKSGHSKSVKAKSKATKSSKGISPSRSPLLRPSLQPVPVTTPVPVSSEVPVTTTPNGPTTSGPSPSTNAPNPVTPASTSPVVPTSVTSSPSPGSAPATLPPSGLSTPSPSAAVPTPNNPSATAPPSARTSGATPSPSSTTTSTTLPSAPSSGNVSPAPALSTPPVSSLPPQSSPSPLSSLPPQTQSPSSPPVNGTRVSATLFAVIYTVTSTTVPTTADFDAAANITLNHIEACLQTYYQTNPTVAVVGIDGTSLGTASDPIRLGYSVDAIFSLSSSPLPTTDEVDQVIAGCFVDPEEAILLSQLNGELPPANPLSTTTAAVSSTGTSTQATTLSVQTAPPLLSSEREFSVVPVTPFDVTFTSAQPHAQDVLDVQHVTMLFLQNCLKQVFDMPVNVTNGLGTVYSSVVAPVRIKFAGTVTFFTPQENNVPTTKQVDTGILFCFKEPSLSQSFLVQIKQLNPSNGFFNTTSVTYTPAPTVVVPIAPPTSGDSQSNSSTFSPAAIFGIVVGVVVYIALHVGVAYYIIQKRQARHLLAPSRKNIAAPWKGKLQRTFRFGKSKKVGDDQALLATSMPHHTTPYLDENLMYFMDKDTLEQGYT